MKIVSLLFESHICQNLSSLLTRKRYVHQIYLELWVDPKINWTKKETDFSAAGPIPFICQVGRQFCRFAKNRSIPFVCWLLSDKNLNALKTSRYKTSPYLLEKKWCCQSRESNPGPLACLPMMLPTELWRLLLWTREILKFIYYYYQILHFCMQKKGRAGQGCCTVYTYNRTVGF